MVIRLTQGSSYGSSGGDTTATTAPDSATPIAASVYLPSPCNNYSTIADPTRLITSAGGLACDNTFFTTVAATPNYIRFIAPGGTQLATSPPNNANGNVCGTQVAGWTNVTYPSVAGQTVNAFVNYAYQGNPSYGYQYWVVVINCNGFYVFGIWAPPNCDYRYCTEP
ncbi:unnamed protein product [Didymodactylos carnosus]|uniref:Uncharacterized protein n=1 Tax=Didymodactylos carnosus TaxID=1234261 RepID=A0A815R7K0_9BILA|nr:unnamed protein product [Didymodactylos carnosus]CAF1566968.1 unnamed protein product [Didymodactylos carnosus]CAF4340024.1 unnamed protein product [Didymodactylos carnosus]CAF4360363.1 unnamed protein product [Didymodactylos carnosus]